MVTDHKPLEVIYGPVPSRACIEHWVIDLTLSGRVCSRQSNIADPLSRLLSRQNTATNHQHGAKEYVGFAAINVTRGLSTREVKEASSVDEELRALRETIKTDQLEECKAYAIGCRGTVCL